MLPLQMVAMACMGTVYTWFIAHTYAPKQAESAKQALISAAKSALKEARKLLGSVATRRPHHPEASQPASSPRATFPTPAPVPTLDVVLPSVASRPPPLELAMPAVVPQKRFSTPSLPSVVFEPKCFAFDKNLTIALSPQCPVIHGFDARAATAPGSWSVNVRTHYTTSVGASLALVIVLLPCFMVVGSAFVRVVRRLGHYALEAHSPVEALVDDDDVIEVKTEGARRLEQLAMRLGDERRIYAPTNTAVVTFPMTDLSTINTQSSLFTIECPGLWAIPPIFEYSGLHFRIVHQGTRDARGYFNIAFTLGLLCKLDELKHSPKMIAARPPPPFFDWSEFNVGEFLHCAERRFYRPAEALDWTTFNMRDFVYRAELVQVDWTMFNIRDFVHRAEVVQVDWTTFNIRDFVYRAEHTQVDWTVFSIRDFVYRAELVQVDWTTFNIRDFIHRAELIQVDWPTINIRQFLDSACGSSRPPRVAKWHRYDIPAFFALAEQASSPANQDAAPAKRPQHLSRSRASLEASDDPAAAEWLQRKNRATQKVPKQDERPATAVKGQFSRHSRRSAQRNLYSEVAAARAVEDRGARDDDDRKDEVDHEHDAELPEKSQSHVDASLASSAASGPSAQKAAEPVSRATTQSTSAASTSSTPATRSPAPAKSTKQRHQPPKAPAKPNKKQGRRGGAAAAMARRQAAQEQREEEEAALADYAARRPELLDGGVTYRQSGPWRIEEASPEAWTRARAPHVAQAFPSPPSGPRPTRAADTFHKKRHGRMKCFTARQSYPDRPVTVVGHDLRIPEALRTAAGEQRRARGAAMDRRRERNKRSDVIDHFLIPLAARLQDVFPVLEDAAGHAPADVDAAPPDHSTTSTTTTPLALSPARA
ncbi:hypothetical protein PsYK624_075930 [Phanerochaete sordida]|uniref:Uncharacterized protein n=1 Tax=Phanerochaete sordida TaxID=48140 RepID=A0A9P3G8R8_9APHY|nr:hypothetical protein PsYK624_075930 [Phanerochaete sordida]